MDLLVVAALLLLALAGPGVLAGYQRSRKRRLQRQRVRERSAALLQDYAERSKAAPPPQAIWESDAYDRWLPRRQAAGGEWGGTATRGFARAGVPGRPPVALATAVSGLRQLMASPTDARAAPRRGRASH